jgi:hypothetical protein
MFDEKKELYITKLITLLPPLYNKDFPIIFFWSPKCGCTTLIKWYFFQTGILQKAYEYNPEVHRYRLDILEKQPNYNLQIKEQLLGNKKDVYILVRNPYKRAVSSFFATIITKTIFKQIAPGQIEGLSFKQFLYLIKNIGVNRDQINVHIAQQYIEKEELFIQKYIRLEQSTPSIREIEEKYNLLQSPIQNIIKPPFHMAQRMTDKSNKMFSEVKMSFETFPKSLPEYKRFDDQETRDLVREIFKKAFEKYDYNPNDLDLL